jgi:hypothetical protein
MKIVNFFCFLLLFFPAVLCAETINTPLDATKGALPECTDGYSLYQELIKIGEAPIWVGEENSELSGNQGKPVYAFFLNEENGNWSFVFTTYPKEETCFVVTGKNWQKVKIEIPDEIALGGDEKKAGYCAPFGQMSKELLESGKTEVWSGFPDMGFLKNDAVEATVYIFFAGSGTWMKVTDTVDNTGAEMSCIDTQGGERKEMEK